ncbi:hypothetical protein JCM8097_002425 [Rhodosporidiobolus ruineniae]
MRLFRSLAGAAALFLSVSPALAAFGVTSSSSALTIDTGASLVFTINTANGNLTSLKYGAKELQDKTKFSHIASGFGRATVSHKTVGEYVVVTSTSTNIGGEITQYFVAKKGENTIYMATHATTEPTVGELRFIARLSKSALPNGYTVSSVDGCTAIEGEDVFSCSTSSSAKETRSKFYSSRQFVDDQVHGVTGDGVGVWMVVPGTGYEKSSGGPFYRDIDNQGTAQQELYFSYRTGLFGPYALVINEGSTPSASLDTSFFGSLGIKCYYGKDERGYVKGTASEIAGEYADYITVGWSDSNAQYWTRASSSGSFTSPAMIPGTYTQSLYKMELEVARKSNVVVISGSITSVATLLKRSAFSSLFFLTPTAIWSIGSPDGTPRGFLNADKIETMHPSDSRMASWGPVVFDVSSSSSSEWPMAQFKDVNNGNQIVFELTAAQAEAARTLEVGITSSFASGRPQVTVNSYTGKAPTAPTKVDSRGVTRGTWRGYNTAYKTVVPGSALVAGQNTATIEVISGSSGDKFLSPNIIFEYIRFY